MQLRSDRNRQILSRMRKAEARFRGRLDLQLRNCEQGQVLPELRF